MSSIFTTLQSSALDVLLHLGSTGKSVNNAELRSNGHKSIDWNLQNLKRNYLIEKDPRNSYQWKITEKGKSVLDIVSKIEDEIKFLEQIPRQEKGKSI